MRFKHFPLLVLLALAAPGQGCAKPSAEGASQAPPEAINFLSVFVDPETSAADTRLRRFLERAIAAGSSSESAQSVTRFTPQTMPYADVIRAFAEPERGRAYIARITPYAYVAAEMLGARLNILAVYKSAATDATTYHSYFVMPKDRFQKYTNRNASEARLQDIETYLGRGGAPARFIYHDRFSTSSYFMPALYFKEHEIYAMSQPADGHLIPIRVEQVGTSSSDLVGRIARGDADLAAVWDRTKQKFERDENLVFVKIPTPVPNDFLVASGVSDRTQRLIIKAIANDPAANRPCTDLESALSSTITPQTPPRRRCSDLDEKLRPQDDYDGWYVWNSNESDVTDAAREALARLRQEGRQQPSPVVVRVEGNRTNLDEAGARLLNEYVDAAREAVRLSGTEFVLEDPDLHKRIDMTWTLESTHDGALKLTTRLDSAFSKSDDPLYLSFVDTNDLPRRIADLVRSRMRRIRYVWPYEQKYPAVMRDLDFTPDRRALVQKISWHDLARNEYEEDTPFHADITNNTDFSKLRLSDESRFPRNPDGTFNFDPMSNVAYRVIISREPQPGRLWSVLPEFFIGLFVVACVGLVIDLRRQQPPPRGLHETYQRMVETYHQPWRAQEIEEGAILWCDAKYIDEFVKELKTAGSVLDLVQAGGLDFNFGPIPVRFSIFMKIASRLFKRRPQLSSELVESSGGGCVAALETLIQFLVHRRRLSPFIGFPEAASGASMPAAWPIEWEALNDITTRHFQRLGISDKRVDANFGENSSALSPVVSQHFRGVIKKASRDASLFHQTWTVVDPDKPGRLVHVAELRSTLLLSGPNGSAPANRVQVEVNLPAGAALSTNTSEPTVSAWIFGKVLHWSVEKGVLSLQVRAMAILRDYDHQH
jgi:ABC-type phosphate/phosphonate transport system substrate-binding protein